MLTGSLSLSLSLVSGRSKLCDIASQMSQLLFGATILVLILVGIVSLDIMGFAFWKGNQFPVEGKVSTLNPHEAEHR